MFMSCTNKF